MSKEIPTLEKFLTEKLNSEISSFGDGMTEFHTRDLEQLLDILAVKNQELLNLQEDLIKLQLERNKWFDLHYKETTRADMLQESIDKAKDITFHAHSMGCGLEDANITDRYKAMEYGYNSALNDVNEMLS